MTQLELFENYPRQRGFSRWLLARIAVLRARIALARVVRSQRIYGLRDIPPHLRRDIGLPEVDEAPWRTINRW